MRRKLVVIVSTEEALQTALTSDLDALCIYHTLSGELGASLLPTMEAAGFYPEGTEDRRGMVFLRREEQKA